MMTRRHLLLGFGAAFATPVMVFAQNKGGDSVRIGNLFPLPPAIGAPILAAFGKSLRELGWVEGQNITFENRYGDGSPDRLAELAAELVSLNVDVIVSGSTPAALAAKNATRTIPIVMMTTADPVKMGIVASLARPGANVTGVTFLGQELAAKRLELLKESVPGVTTVAVLSDPAFPETASAVKAMPDTARALGVHLHIEEIRDPKGFEDAFMSIKRARAGALLVLTSIMFLTHRRQIADLAARNRLPSMYPLREYLDAGGLMFYGVSLP